MCAHASLVLVAAMLALPSTWQRKFAGLAIGVVAVQGLNVIRVISLFYLGQWRQDVFDFAHQYVWQALIMLDVLVIWLLWVRTLARVPPAALPAWARRATYRPGVAWSAPRRGPY